MSTNTHICPICGREYNAEPALSRIDNRTRICPDCGMKEAMVMYTFVSDYDKLRDKLSTDIISTAGHKSLLDNVPHFEMEDLSVIFRIRISEGDNSLSSYVITNQMIDNVKISGKQLIDDALKYAPKNFPVEYTGITGIFADMVGIDEKTALNGKSEIMYAASVKSHVRGACVIAYPDFMENTTVLLNGDFYILPSSIHEVIVLKDEAEFNAHDLMDMVTDINASIVSAQDKLIDNAYHYDHNTHTFETAIRYEERTSL